MTLKFIVAFEIEILFIVNSIFILHLVVYLIQFIIVFINQIFDKLIKPLFLQFHVKILDILKLVIGYFQIPTIMTH